MRLTLVFAAFFASLPAFAGTGDAVLAQVDVAMNKAKDQTMTMSASTTEPGRAPRDMKFTVQLLGEQRLVEFSAPGDLAGTRVLVLGRNQMYIYLPAYNKVRRVATHATEQGFMGTTFSDEDMSTSFYAAAWEASLDSDGAEQAVLTLTPKPGTTSAYTRLRMTVDKQHLLPVKIEYYNPAGQLVKTETRSDITCQGPQCGANTLTMVDHTREGATTTMTRTEWSTDGGLSPELFTVRNLQRE